LKAFSIIGLCIFGIVFSLFITIPLVFTALPPGSMFEGIGNNLVNGVFYGFIGWLIYAVVVSLYGSKPELEIRFKPERELRIEEPAKIEVPQPKVQKEVKMEPEETGIPIIEIEGIGPTYAEKLNSIGIYTTNDLLESGGTRIGRQEISEKTDISETLILEWVNLADLMRIKGVGEEYSDLLEEAGVDTVAELAQRNPDNLYAKLIEVNEEKELVRQLPNLDDVTSWVEQAKTLPRKIEY
jgi:predicted flap endonuclease-1-like 5' DNA nuclease